MNAELVEAGRATVDEAVLVEVRGVPRGVEGPVEPFAARVVQLTSLGTHLELADGSSAYGRWGGAALPRRADHRVAAGGPGHGAHGVPACRSGGGGGRAAGAGGEAKERLAARLRAGALRPRGNSQ
ncbi:hypothetical protein [Pyxidicoccus trucidator]|uniref:hypothetical protein n=1 Tax=Pyxidicoccus trucidator TaxID=2709662 RepID=UPI0013DB4EC1|nr:hypothetical protein [Pyxidicoccus trucidator]